MTTAKTILYEKTFSFVIYGSEELDTNIYQFVNGLDESDVKKLYRILDAINSKPMSYRHPEKFKRWEGQIWEIKVHQIRIGCYWQIKGKLLVGIYGFRKKDDDWPDGDAQKARRLYDHCSKYDFRKEKES